ncbi:MAG: hypothetical protein WDM79_00450 [Terricaulis sp.]
MKAALRATTDEAQERGVFGAPTFTTRMVKCSGAMIGWKRRLAGPHGKLE